MPRDTVEMEVSASLENAPRPTAREARKALIDQFIVALRERPADFSEDGYYLRDKRAGMRWWVASGRMFFRLEDVASCGCTGLDFGWWQTRRAWKALSAWRRRTPTDLPHAHEAVRLWQANRAARQGKG